MVRDITESKLAEAEALQQTREVAVLEERNRMAREIHDTMAQGFTGIVLQMEAAEQSLEASPAALPEHLNRARALAREGLQEARRSVLGTDAPSSGAIHVGYGIARGSAAIWR